MIFNILFVGYWTLAFAAMFTIYKAINGYQTHHCVDEDDEFYGEDLEAEKWRDYNRDIASGLNLNGQ
jgi:hypothetical protein